VKSIFVYPDWNPDVITFDADIAVIDLENEISFNNYIQPICLLTPNLASQAKSGVLVGYGKSEDESKLHENIPKQLNVPIHTQEKCFLSNKNLVQISSERTFCAGSGNGTGACLGDSGGGFYVIFSNIFYLRGIVSSSLRKGFSCDVDAYSVYTDVLKFQNWIETLEDINKNFERKTEIEESDKVEEILGEVFQCGDMSSRSALIQGWWLIFKFIFDF
jgi:secreted trypsin-like serine protease